MDRRSLLGVGLSCPGRCESGDPRPERSRASLTTPGVWGSAPLVALLVLTLLCGCGRSPREAARKPRETARERPSGAAQESPPDVEPGAGASVKTPLDEKAIPGHAAAEPSGSEPGAKLEYRLPDEAAMGEAAIGEEPMSEVPEGPLAPMRTPAPTALPEKSFEDNPRYAEPKLDRTYAQPQPAAEVPSPLGGSRSPATTRADKGFSRVRVFYATDRQRGGDTPNEFYTDQRRLDESALALDLGYCEVSVPYRHAPGEVERPSIWKLEFRENPAKHVVLLNVQPVEQNQWQADVRDSVNESEDKAALVFVHGFNVDFASAARRMAQMKYDLGFQGAAILYSWPAPGNYVECEGNTVWTLPHLMEFLTRYVQLSGAAKIHLVAHSMGTRVLTTALKELAQSPAAAPVRYNEIILAAPDIDAAIFKQQIAPRIVTAAERISIYSSSQDWALVASKKAHRYKRLGEGGENLTTFPEWPQIEVLDATNVDESLLGHSYYGNSPTILRDVRGVLAGFGAAARGLRAQASYYVFNTRRTQLSQRPR